MGFYMASSRLMYSMSRDGYLPAWFGGIEEKHRTPKNDVLPIPGLSGVHFCMESYILLVVWCLLGGLFYIRLIKKK